MKHLYPALTALAVIVLSSSAQAAVHTVYANHTLALPGVGTIPVATPLQELGNSQGKLKVEITGVQPSGNHRAIFKSADQRIVLAALTPEMAERITAGKSFTDAYGKPWRHVSLTLQIPDDVTASQQPLWHQAEQLRDTACSVCHAAPQPGQLSANAWPATVRSMGGRTTLSQDELHLLTAYYQYNAAQH